LSGIFAERNNRQTVSSVLLLALVLLMDLLEGVSPPADGDTLAYHAAIPKYFAEIGGIEFLPTAVTGAIPLLTHLIYTSAYIMGGELALTLWLMISGWATALLVYAYARRYVSNNASGLLAILFLTTPAILFSGGNGHVEVRAAGYVLAACIFFADGRQSGSLKSFVLIGIFAGCFIATKYFGLVFAASLGLAILLYLRRPGPVLVYTVVAVAVGFQWYLWNYLHTGDPVFPSLFTLLGAPDGPYWTAEFSSSFAAYYSDAEKILSTTIKNWLLYPVYATFSALPELESTRTGFGVFPFMILPFAIWGAAKKRVWTDDRFMFLAVAGIFFTVWFFSGTTHRARHLVPVFPLVLFSVYLFAHEVVAQRGLLRLFWAAVYLAVFIQLTGQLVFSANYAKHILTGESRQAFLERNVTGANAVFWINKNVAPGAKVAYFNRELGYLLDLPSFFMTAHYQIQVEWRPNRVMAKKFTEQIEKNSITHFILKPPEQKNAGRGPELGNFRMLQDLMNAGCLRKMKTFDTVVVPSRTFSVFSENMNVEKMALYRLMPKNCPR
jgi:4-amino-4-deoxy-L-arabinose transferase-like glycosyltransferase